MARDADVIIVGAGPAGSMAAYDIAKGGGSVLLLEKARFPRYKVCGAGLTHKILKEIPFDLSPVLETEIRTIVFSHKFSGQFSRSSGDPMMYCTTRENLDQFLLDKAVTAGARVMHGIRVTGVEQDQDGVTVHSTGGTFRAALVIGAEGASGTISRTVGLRDNILPGLAWEAEVTADPEVIRQFGQTVFLDWGSFPGGYGWVFPKADHFSIGVGGPASLSKWMMPYYGRFLAYLAHGDVLIKGNNSRVPPLVVKDTLSMRSWPIPIRVKKDDFHRGRVVVTGDSAGLTDPLTGEGIHYAIRSGQLAAVSCLQFLGGSTVSLVSYSEAVNQELMEELLEARRIGNIFNTFPVRIHNFVRNSDRAWRAFVRILRGERRYADVRGGFGKWRFLWGITGSLSGMMAAFRERKFGHKGFN